MGKTSKPLWILVDPSLLEWEEVQALKQQGHTIYIPPTDHTAPDIILGPICWRMDETLRTYLPLAIKEARQRRYGGTQGGTSSGE